MIIYRLLAVAMVLSLLVLVVAMLLYLQKRSKAKSSTGTKSSSISTSRTMFFTSSISGDDDEPDITSFETKDIPKSGLFSASERRMEYRRRGKSPSGVIDGVYNDMYREDGHPYNDMDRDWDADA